MKRKENIRAERRAQRAKNAKMHATIAIVGGTTDNNSTVSQSDNLTNEISTVYNIKKPSANGIYIPAEGCISESRAIRACLMIRVFNN